MPRRSIPQPPPLGRASPTVIEGLRECGLRVALSRLSSGKASSNPWARLGSICHAIYEAAARGGLGDGEEDFNGRFEAAWAAAAAAEGARARLSPEEVGWGAVERWPSYSDKKARMRRRARDLALQVAAWVDADFLVEEMLEPEGDVLHGQPDLVVRRPGPHRVIDYKTGLVIEGDEHALKASYRRQLLLYAYLESRMPDGGRPEQVSVVPLRGEPITLAVDWDEVHEEVTDACQLVARFNETLDPLSLASPSATACGHCPHAAVCPSLWDSADEGWGPALVAVSGIVESVAMALNGTTTVGAVLDAGTQPAGPVIFQRFPTARHPQLAALNPGMRIRLVGGRVVAGAISTITPAGWSRVAVFPAE